MSKVKTFVFITCFVLVLVLVCAVKNSQADLTITLSPELQGVSIGNVVTIDISMDFSSDPTIGGGFDVFYDSSLLSFGSFVFDSSLGDDPAFRSIGTDDGFGEIDGIGFGEFMGLSGPATIGTLTFTALDVGLAGISLAETDNGFVGGFYSATTYGSQTVTFGGATVNIEAASVPEPSTALLLGINLIVTIGVGASKTYKQENINCKQLGN